MEQLLHITLCLLASHTQSDSAFVSLCVLLLSKAPLMPSSALLDMSAHHWQVIQVQKLRLHKCLLLYLERLGSSLSIWSFTLTVTGLTVPDSASIDENKGCVPQSMKQLRNLS